jgi:hypothetical protein
MVSVIENINMDNDDSDTPIEVTTKTSKTEKKKKKKRRIKYTLATEEDDDNNTNGKHLDEESALTHLIFGDDDDYLEELTSVAKTDKQVYRKSIR